MKRATAISLGLAALLGTTAHSATVVEKHGAMKVVGNQIVNKDNVPFQVAGMSFFWSAWMSKYWNANVVNTLVNDWNCGLVRAAMGVEGNGMYLLAKETNKQMVRTVVDAAIAKGVYVIIDWHDHNANKNVNEAKAFFSEMAQLYKNTPNVIWEIWNEPDGTGGTGTNGKDDWVKDIKPYAQAVIPEIRKYSSNLIVVGTPNWAQDVESAANDPLTEFENIAYTLHFYAGTHTGTLRTKANAALSAGIALFITEWGTSVANGGTTGTPPVSDNTVYTTASDTWLAWAKTKKISWANWSIADKNESSASLLPGAPGNGSWTDANLSPAGIYVRSKIREVATYEFSGVTPRQTKLSGFSARSVAGDLRISLPSQASELLVRDLSGRTLEQRKLSGEQEMRLQAPQGGVVLVQVTAPAGTQAIPVAIAR